MKIEDIENSVPLTQDKVNDNEDHNNEKLKAPKKSFWKSKTPVCKVVKRQHPCMKVGRSIASKFSKLGWHPTAR